MKKLTTLILTFLLALPTGGGWSIVNAQISEGEPQPIEYAVELPTYKTPDWVKEEDQKSRNSLEEKSQNAVRYYAEIHFGEYQRAADIERIHEEYDIVIRGFSQFWPRSGTSGFGDGNRRNDPPEPLRPLQVQFEEYRNERTKTLKRYIGEFEPAYDSGLYKGFGTDDNANLLHQNTGDHLEGLKSELHYLKRDGRFFAYGMRFTIPVERMEDFLANEDVYLITLGVSKKKICLLRPLECGWNIVRTPFLVIGAILISIIDVIGDIYGFFTGTSVCSSILPEKCDIDYPIDP